MSGLSTPPPPGQPVGSGLPTDPPTGPPVFPGAYGAGADLPAEPAEAREDRRRRAVLDGLGDLSVVVAWCVVAGLLAAVVWWQVTPLAEFTRTATNGEMGEQALAREVAADGWFFVVCAVFGLITGIALVWWRRRDPLLMVLLVAAGGILATWVMVTVGLALGPADPGTVLPDAALGAKVPLQLEVQATGLYATWSVAALIGAIGVIWGTERR